MTKSQLENPASALDDELYCQEDYTSDTNNNNNNEDFLTQVGKIQLYEQDLYWDEDELTNLLSKEEINEKGMSSKDELDPLVFSGSGRKEAVDWMLKVHSHYSFSVITALLAVNYLDRFMSRFEFQKDKHWMAQLSAVACLSLAAKIEETFVPLLVDFQIEGSKYVFEAKTIQRMEILVLSTLQWKMNPVTPYSFLDYLTRRFPLKDFLCREFLRSCERILLSIIADSRFMCYLPSVMAASTILHVSDCFEPCIEEEYHNQLLGVLGVDKEKIQECCQFISELAVDKVCRQSNKRKSMSVSRPGSPNGVIDLSFSSDSSNDSWETASMSSSQQLTKKLRTFEGRQLKRCNHSSVDFLSIYR